MRRRDLAAVDAVVLILRAGEPTKFRFEAACVHGLRSRACELGMRFERAEMVAGEIVAAALKRLGVARPSWAEGQPEFVARMSVYCRNCAKPLTWEGHNHHRHYCDHFCRYSFENRKKYAERAEEERARVAARRALAKKTAPEKPCKYCGKPFLDTTKYCSETCRHKAASERTSRWNKEHIRLAGANSAS